MSEEHNMATCVEILEEARKLLPGRFGGLDNTIRELKLFEDDFKGQREKLIEICTRKIDGSQELNFLNPISFGLKSRIHNLSRFVIDLSESVARWIIEKITSKDKADPTTYNFMLCATYLFVELFAQEEEIKKEREANVTPPEDKKPKTTRDIRNKSESSHAQYTTRAVSDRPTSQHSKQPKRHLELRMLVESTYLAPLESLQANPDQPLNEEQLEAVFKRPNIHKLHARDRAGSAGERSFVYDNGESFFVKASQLYLCVNIELECKDASYQELLTTKSLSVMKRRLRGARFTLRELRYEKLNDTTRVTTGTDD